MKVHALFQDQPIDIIWIQHVQFWHLVIDDPFMELYLLAPDLDAFQTDLASTFFWSFEHESQVSAHAEELDFVRLAAGDLVNLAC